MRRQTLSKRSNENVVGLTIFAHETAVETVGTNVGRIGLTRTMEQLSLHRITAFHVFGHVALLHQKLTIQRNVLYSFDLKIQ